MVSRKQWGSGAKLYQSRSGGRPELRSAAEGRPAGLERGWFVQPTVFTGVSNDMRIAARGKSRPGALRPSPTTMRTKPSPSPTNSPTDCRPYVESVGYVRTRVGVAGRLDCGGVTNQWRAARTAGRPSAGFKQSGIGREYGRYGLEAHLEVRAILG